MLLAQPSPKNCLAGNVLVDQGSLSSRVSLFQMVVTHVFCSWQSCTSLFSWLRPMYLVPGAYTYSHVVLVRSSPLNILIRSLFCSRPTLDSIGIFKRLELNCMSPPLPSFFPRGFPHLNNKEHELIILSGCPFSKTENNATKSLFVVLSICGILQFLFHNWQHI